MDHYRNEYYQAELAQAIAQIDTARIQEAVDHGADVNEKLPDGTPPLIKAVEMEDDSLVSLLLTLGAEVDQVDNEGNTALLVACDMLTDLTIIDILIQHHADTFVTNLEGLQTPLINAAKRNQVAILRHLLTQGQEFARPEPNHRNTEGHTPLMMAASVGSEEALQYLLVHYYNPQMDEHLDVDEKDFDGNTALHWAVESQHTVSIELLIQSGADINSTDNDGQTPVDVASTTGMLHLFMSEEEALDVYMGSDIESVYVERAKRYISQDRVQLLRALITQHQEQILGKAEVRQDLLVYSIGLEKILITELLLSEGCDPSEAAHHNDKILTPLITAVRSNNLDLIQLLVNRQADKLAQDHKGRTALMWACKKRNLVAVETLLTDQITEQLEMEDLEGDRALSVAIQRDHYLIVKHLLRKGAEVNWANHGNLTPLIIAIDEQLYGIVEKLLQHKADPNYSGSNGHTTPLIQAMYLRSSLFAKRLIRAGANVNATDHRQKTALYHAVSENDWYLSKILLDAGARVSSEITSLAVSPRLKQLLLQSVSKGKSWQQICEFVKKNRFSSKDARALEQIAVEILPITRAKLKKLHPKKMCRLLAKQHHQDETRFAQFVQQFQKRSRDKYLSKIDRYRLPKNWHTHCDWEADSRTLLIVKSDLQVVCFSANIVDWSYRSRMCEYKPKSGRTPESVEPAGYGSEPISRYFFPLPLEQGYRGYLSLVDFRVIKERIEMENDPTRPVLVVYLGTPDLVRMGNCRGEFGESQLHGQAPGEPVYPIQFIKSIGPPTTDDELTQQKDKSLPTMTQLQIQFNRLNSSVVQLRPIVADIHHRMEQDNLSETDLSERDQEVLTQYRNLRQELIAVMRQSKSQK